jgi:small subunit ribosomal protein S1
VLSSDERGLIIDLGLKRDGVVPRSDLEELSTEEGRLGPGDEISVMVVEPLDGDGNLVVSVAQARESSDWLKAQRLMERDEILEAEVGGYNRGGLIVPFGRLRGFVPASHISELPRGLDEESQAKQLAAIVNRKLPFKVIAVDPRRRRLVLSERKAIRQWRQDQKARVIQTLKVGDNRSGVVTSLREFGAFVDIGGADGLIHISELSWDRVDDPSEVLQVGQEVETLVIRLDQEASRIGLSLKRLQPNPWEGRSTSWPGSCCMDGVTLSVGAYIRFDLGLKAAEAPGGQPSETVRPSRWVALRSEHERLDRDAGTAAVEARTGKEVNVA